jgi:hypothetical protein
MKLVAWFSALVFFASAANAELVESKLTLPSKLGSAVLYSDSS